VDWVSVEEGEITLCYIVPLIIISSSRPFTPPTMKNTNKNKNKTNKGKFTNLSRLLKVSKFMDLYNIGGIFLRRLTGVSK
jgi:hypothetical protein